MIELPPARILDVDPSAYHKLPGLSASIAKVVIKQSPGHAQVERERLATKMMDIGQVNHRLVLGKGKDYKVCDFDDWRTKDSKAEREAARAAGLVPILPHQLEEAQKSAASIIKKLAERDIVLDGQSELAIEWWEHSEFGPVRCRAMLDHCWIDRGEALELKITEDASPLASERTAESLGYAIQYAAYTRAMVALDPSLAGRTKFRFAFCEPSEPFALNLRPPDGLFREHGERQWLRAVAIWARCTHENRWPTYGEQDNPISVPAWALAREEEHAA